MVYMEPVALGIVPLLDSWYATIPATFLERKQFLPSIKNIIDKYLDRLLIFMRKNCKENVVTIANNLVESMLKIMNSFFAPFIESETNRIEP